MSEKPAAYEGAGSSRPAGSRFDGFAVACLVLVVVSLFLVQVPKPILDLLLVTNLLLSLVLLLRVLLIDRAARLTAFPTMLLLLTLLRLGLNVASSRLILLSGDQGHDAAGQVIKAFGQFLVQGNVVVGGIIFVLIAVINLIVVTKGSARVAEVAARFALDALPGKQLALDSDLRAGRVSRDEMERRRADLSSESQFYGAMDGAMKFIQGDAIAGIIIAGVNLAGGMALGLSRGLSLPQAFDSFGILTIGDGLVSIVPSLLVSVCAGILVTSVSKDDKSASGGEVFAQLFEDRRLVVGVGFFALIASAVPGVPFVPFIVLGLLLTAPCFYGLWRRAIQILPAGSRQDHLELFFHQCRRWFRGEQSNAWAMTEATGASASSALPVRMLTVSLHPELARSVGLSREELVAGISRAFRDLKESFMARRGVLLPDVHVAWDTTLRVTECAVLVREQQLRRALVYPGQYYVVASIPMLTLFGASVRDTVAHPCDERTGHWVDMGPNGIRALRRLGIELHSPWEFLALEALGSALQVIEEILGYGEVENALRGVERLHARLLEQTIGNGLLSTSELMDLCRRLAREGVAIRDLQMILEGVLEYHANHSQLEDRRVWLLGLHAFLRLVLRRSILSDCVRDRSVLRTFVLAGDVVEEFREAAADWVGGRTRVVLSPDVDLRLRTSASRLFGPILERGVVPLVILSPADIRLAVQDFFSGNLASAETLRVLSYDEVSGYSPVESVGMLSAS